MWRISDGPVLTFARSLGHPELLANVLFFLAPGTGQANVLLLFRNILFQDLRKVENGDTFNHISSHTHGYGCTHTFQLLLGWSSCTFHIFSVV